MTLLPTGSLLKVAVRAWQFAGPSVALTFVIVWMVRNPISDIAAIASILVLATVFALLGTLPVVLLLLLCQLFLQKFAPRLLSIPLLAAAAFMIAGGAMGLGEAYFLFARLGPESEFFQVMMLAGAVGGIVAGWIISDGKSKGKRQKAKIEDVR